MPDLRLQRTRDAYPPCLIGKAPHRFVDTVNGRCLMHGYRDGIVFERVCVTCGRTIADLDTSVTFTASEAAFVAERPLPRYGSVPPPFPSNRMRQTFRAFVWLSDRWRADPSFKFDDFADRMFRACVEAHGGGDGSVLFSRELNADDLAALGWQERPDARCYMLEGKAETR